MTNTSKTFYYARVSTDDQVATRQYDALIAAGAPSVRDIFTDKQTGKNFDRPQYIAMKQQMRRGDTLVVKELDRFGRNKSAILSELNWFRENGIRVKVTDIPTTMLDWDEAAMGGQEWLLSMVNNILIEVYASLAQHELDHRAQRQAEGYAAMQIDENGRHISSKTGAPVGRAAAVKPENWDSVITAWQLKKITAVAAAKELGLGRTTFYKMVKEEGIQA